MRGHNRLPAELPKTGRSPSSNGRATVSFRRRGAAVVSRPSARSPARPPPSLRARPCTNGSVSRVVPCLHRLQVAACQRKTRRQRSARGFLEFCSTGKKSSTCPQKEAAQCCRQPPAATPNRADEFGVFFFLFPLSTAVTALAFIYTD